MANIIPNSFRGALFEANHNPLKLQVETALVYLCMWKWIFSIHTASTVYSATDEVSSGGGSNYAVKVLTRLGVASTTAVASVDFDNVTWSSATFTAAYAAIYNTDTVDGTANRLVVVLDFGGAKTATNGDFTITFPDPTTPANAIISMS